MSFRTRLTLAAAVAVAVAVAVASAVTYFVVRDKLRGDVDDALRARAVAIQRRPVLPRDDGHHPRGAFGETPTFDQVVAADGEIVDADPYVALPVSSHTRAVAAGDADGYFSDEDIEGVHVRMLTAPVGLGFAVQVIRPLTEVDATLARIRTLLFLVALGGIGIAAALGFAVARAVLRPVRRLTETAEHVTATGDLDARIGGHGRDELGRLASTFDTMLAALEESARAQRQLVADASHELRTPLTSLRTNIEVLARDEEMPRADRERLLHDVVEQLTEMTALIAELVELARGDAQPLEPEDVRLDLLVEGAVGRARRNAPDVEFRLDAEEAVVHAVPSRLERAVGNLLDNAAKWSPPRSSVDVTVRGGEVVVRDRGPGIADADLPFVFDRFYRAPEARGTPGSGLGLAIVKQVADESGGTVVAERADGGGAQLRLSLPVVAATSEPAADHAPAPVDESAQTRHEDVTHA